MGQKQSKHLLAQWISLYLEAHQMVVELSGAGGVKRMCMKEQHRRLRLAPESFTLLHVK